MNHAPGDSHITFRLAARVFRARPGQRLAVIAVIGTAAVLTFGLLARAGDAEDATSHAHHGMPMTEDAMRAEAQAYWASRQPVGTSAEALLGVPAATFTVDNFIFELGTAGQVDTAQILVGESVMWQWLAGIHTVTNGSGSLDPNAGTIFDQPMSTSSQQFTFTFNSAGTYPFFCSFHELTNMKGVVVVSEVNGVEPDPNSRALGFTRDPAPNPTPSGLRFQYALRGGGHVRAEVFDASGRRVAVIVDDDLPAGAYSASWNGRTSAGPADTGVYYVRLRFPGYDQSRRVVVRR